MNSRNRIILIMVAIVLVVFVAKNYLKNLFTPLDKTQHRIEQGLAPVNLTPEQVRNLKYVQGIRVEIKGIAENCQARVIQDGVTLFGGYLDVGESRVFEGKREVRVKVVPGNCLEIAINGASFEKLSPSPNVVERTYLPQSH